MAQVSGLRVTHAFTQIVEGCSAPPQLLGHQCQGFRPCDLHRILAFSLVRMAHARKTVITVSHLATTNDGLTNGVRSCKSGC